MTLILPPYANKRQARPARSTKRRLLPGFGLTAALVFFAGLAVAQAADRGLLWRVVQTCVANNRITGGSFPCLDVNLAKGQGAGFVVLRAPFEATHIVVVPTIRLDGIEDPRLQQADAENYFADAWAARRFVSDRAPRALARDEIGLALNSRPGRSQDQLHIHVDCLQAGTRNALKASATTIQTRTWTRLPLLLHNDRYWALKLKIADLASTNLFELVMNGLHVAEDERPKVTIVVAAAGERPDDGFYVLALVATRSRHDQGHGEFLLDHSCSAS